MIFSEKTALIYMTPPGEDNKHYISRSSAYSQETDRPG